MTRMQIHFDLNNAAFDESPCGEVARILRDLANRMEDGIFDVTKISDLNGNRIGQAEYFHDD